MFGDENTSIPARFLQRGGGVRGPVPGRWRFRRRRAPVLPYTIPQTPEHGGGCMGNEWTVSLAISEIFASKVSSCCLQELLTSGSKIRVARRQIDRYLDRHVADSQGSGREGRDCAVGQQELHIRTSTPFPSLIYAAA